MAAIPSSPAVLFIEKDNSSYPPNIESSIVGIVGYASKGPTNELTLITSQENLLATFGAPSESLVGQGLLGALEILETTNQVRFVRAIPSDATYASGSVVLGACPAVKVEASSIGVGFGPYYFKIIVKDNAGVEKLNKNITIPAGTATSFSGQAAALARYIGDGTVVNDHVSVYWDNDTKDSGYIVGSYAGSGATLQVSSFQDASFSALKSGKTFNPVYYGAGVTNPIADNYSELNGTSATTAHGATILTSSLSYLSRALYQGAGYNLGSNPANGQTSGLSITVVNTSLDKSNLSVNVDGINSETYRISPVAGLYYIEDVINRGVDAAVSNYIMGELRTNTLNVTPTALTSFIKTTNNLVASAVTGYGVSSATGTSAVQLTGAAFAFVKPVEGTYTFSGGSNGTMTAYDGIIGTPAEKTGIYALDDDTKNISLAIVPGIHDQDVQNNLITLAETSQNFLAAVSPPVGLDTVEDAVDWMNGKGTRTAAINSSWACVFWPHVQVYSVFDGKDRWYDPAIFAIRQMTFTDNVADSWFAPAGFRRGRLTKPTAVEKSLNQGDRDALYGSNVNPIVNFNPEGITIFGQKTAQRAPTSLDRINVRRLMIYLRKVLLASGRIDLFEPNDAFTWDAIREKAEIILSDIQARRGITDFTVVCDSTTNTPLRVDRNELWCKILLRPTKTAEWIVFEVNLTSQSAKFNG